MNLSVGIVGLPNAGKSTLFNALLKKQVAFVANFPFATIEPNVGVVPVPDERLEKIAIIIGGGNPHASLREAQDGGIKLPPIVPATVKFVDIAGLVAGAAQGEGLGNKFLAHIREVDLICYVLRQFQDSDVVHVSGDINPIKDLEILDTELMLADLQTLEKQIEPRGKIEKEALKKWELIKLLKQQLERGKKAREILVDETDKICAADLHLLTMKPALYVVNVGEDQLQNSTNQLIFKLTKPQFGETDQHIKESDILLVSAKIESELAELTETEQLEYLKSLGLEKTGLDRLIQKAYARLGLVSFLTGGELEARAWTITNGTKAPQAASVIHTDFEKKFIKAEIVTYADFVAVGGWNKARNLGKLRLEGKEYVIRDGEVVEFKIGS